MTAPTEAEIREALTERLNHPTDDNARDVDWIDYLSDGLSDIWPAARNAAGDAIAEHPPVLAALLDEARALLVERVHQLAIDELTRVGLAYAATREAATA